MVTALTVRRSVEGMSPRGCYLVIDGGTSRTRVRTLCDGRIVHDISEAVGARDVAREGSPRPLQASIRRLIAAAQEDAGRSAQAVVCSGMMTSDVGLVEIPHQSAPISLDDLALKLVRRDLPSVSALPTYFVPGVKTVGEARSWDGLAAFDSMRGEEVEVAGLLRAAHIEPPTAFLHCGSHHKLIIVGEGDVIERSVTALTGELLAAIRESTVLASSLTPLDEVRIDRAAVAAGMRLVREHGFARAAFLVRAGGMLAGFRPNEVTCFLLGGLAALDEQCLENAMPAGVELVIYGGGLFPRVLADTLAKESRSGVRVLGSVVSDQAAAIGAVRLLEARLEAA